MNQKRLQLGPASEVAIVRRIFAEYLNGASLRGICVALNAEDVKSANGGTCSPQTIRAFLTCETYAGRYVWNCISGTWVVAVAISEPCHPLDRHGFTGELFGFQQTFSQHRARTIDGVQAARLRSVG